VPIEEEEEEEEPYSCCFMHVKLVTGNVYNVMDVIN
jgi:hypothetical protein